jgi:hypothetical protein
LQNMEWLPTSIHMPIVMNKNKIIIKDPDPDPDEEESMDNKKDILIHDDPKDNKKDDDDIWNTLESM